MNCDSWLPPKNSFIAATTGRMLMSAFGVALSISWIVIRSRTTRSIRRRPIRKAFWMSSPLARIRRLPRWSMSSDVQRRSPIGFWPSMLSSIRWPTIAAMSSRVIVRSSRGSSMPIRAATASSFLSNL